MLLLAGLVSAQTQDPEVAALRKQVDEQAKAIAELRSALAELKAARSPAEEAHVNPTAAAKPVPTPTAIPAPTPMESVEPSPTVTAAPPRPFNPWPINTTTHYAPLAVRIGSGVTINPYGMIKLSTIRDSNSSSGDDFPFFARVVATGAESANTTGTANTPASFRFKARSSRLGVDIAAPDPNGVFSIFGKLEFDFEGSFPISTNRTIGSLRSSEASIREAWVQLNVNNAPFFMRFGLAPTLFGSTTQPTGLETSAFYAFQGNIQERDPGAVIGGRFDLGGASDWRVLLEGGAFLASGGEAVNGLGSAYAGNNPAPGQGTLGFGQREGANSDRPSTQSRAMLEFEPWKGRRLAASWIGGSVEYAERTRYFNPPFQTAGLTFGTTSATKGYTAEMGLVMPVMTVLAKYYRGDDLRFYFGGVAQDIFFDGPAPLTTTGAIPVQRPVRAQGGFVQFQLPLSAWFQPVNPRLHGFSLNLMTGYDSAFSRDARRAQNRKAQESVTASFLYQYNRFWQIGIEAANMEAIYLTIQGGLGRSGRVGRDVRWEFSNIFTF
jgi:hypothetical protein